VRGASADVSPRVELHTTLEVDGLRRMQAVPELSVAPGERIGFRPGGLHLMLMDMPRMPAMGETVQLCLLTDGDNACTTAPVQRDAAAAQP
jgi:copper(I)-binding protein